MKVFLLLNIYPIFFTFEIYNNQIYGFWYFEDIFTSEWNAFSDFFKSFLSHSLHWRISCITFYAKCARNFCRDKCIQFSFLHIAKKNYEWTRKKRRQRKEIFHKMLFSIVAIQSRNIFVFFQFLFFFLLLLRRSVWTDRTNI